jgi:hypothetical protein
MSLGLFSSQLVELKGLYRQAFALAYLIGWLLARMPKKK